MANTKEATNTLGKKSVGPGLKDEGRKVKKKKDKMSRCQDVKDEGRKIKEERQDVKVRKKM